MNGRLSNAKLVVIVACTVWPLTVIARMVGEITGWYSYRPDQWEIDIIRVVIGAAISVLTVGSLAGIRMLLGKKDDK